MTPERLHQVDRAESALRGLGITGNLRVRHYGDLAKVEIDGALLPRWTTGDALETLVGAVTRAGFARVEVDPRGFRSGALNVLEGRAALPGD